MCYHDFHLAGYSVSDYGRTIVLHLVDDAVGNAKQESLIEFSNVGAYHFIQTGGAIITEMTEISLGDLLQRWANDLGNWSRQHGGYPHWDDNLEIYRLNLERENYRAWTIVSAIGFEGFVIGKGVAQVEPDQTSNAANAIPGKRF